MMRQEAQEGGPRFLLGRRIRWEGGVPQEEAERKDSLGRRKRRAVVGMSPNVNGRMSCSVYDKIMSLYE